MTCCVKYNRKVQFQSCLTEEEARLLLGLIFIYSERFH